MMRMGTVVVLLAAATSCAVVEERTCWNDDDCAPGYRCDDYRGRCTPIVTDSGTDDFGGVCDPVNCAATCRASGYSGGMCLGTTCQCSGTPSDGGGDGPDAGGCDPATCSASCAGMGLIGTCREDECVCGGGTDADADAADDVAVLDEATLPDETPIYDDVGLDDVVLDGDGRRDDVEEDTVIEDTGPTTGPCPGPFSGSGSWGDSGWTCLARYTFPAIAGNRYTISTCASYSGDPYLVVSGACSCEDDDGCGTLASECSCTASRTGDAEICASSYSMSDATWSYTITGECAL